MPSRHVILASFGVIKSSFLSKSSLTPTLGAVMLTITKNLILFQIPPPKPPPPEMHFIPNPANTEFICLLGLEECVGKILHENKEITVQPIPFTCSQCSTDFTPTWKWDKGARGSSLSFYPKGLSIIYYKTGRRI